MQNSYLYAPPGPNERFERGGNRACGNYYCTVCGELKHGYNDGTEGGSASMFSAIRNSVLESTS